MRNYASFRLTAHALFGAGLMTMIRSGDRNAAVFAVCCALVFAASFIAVRLENAALRLAIGLAPALSLLMPVTGVYTYAAVGALTLYTAAVLAAGRFGGEGWRYRREVVWLIILGLFFMLASLVDGIYTRNPRYFFVLSFVFMILALRAVRTGPVKNAVWQAESAGGWLAVLGIGAGAGGLFYLLLPVLKYIGYGLAWFFGGFVILWTKLWDAIFRNTLPPETTVPSFTPDPSFVPEAPLDVNPRPDYGGDYASLNVPVNIDAKTLLIAAAVIAVIVITVLVIKNAGGTEPAKEERFTFEEDPDRIMPKRTRRRKKDRTDADAVREIYRRYLGVLRQRRVMIARSSTSEDVSRLAEGTVGDDRTLRAIYRKARYGARGGVSYEELLLAEECYERLVNNRTEDNERETDTREQKEAH